jgi:hypothetical protein
MACSPVHSMRSLEGTKVGWHLPLELLRIDGGFALQALPCRVEVRYTATAQCDPAGLHVLNHLGNLGTRIPIDDPGHRNEPQAGTWRACAWRSEAARLPRPRPSINDSPHCQRAALHPPPSIHDSTTARGRQNWTAWRSGSVGSPADSEVSCARRTIGNRHMQEQLVPPAGIEPATPGLGMAWRAAFEADWGVLSEPSASLRAESAATTCRHSP